MNIPNEFTNNKIPCIAWQIITSLCFITLSCGHKSDINISQASQQLCDCFSKQQKGDIDAKMSPCINAIANSDGNSTYIFKITNDADSAIIKLKTDSIKKENLRFISAITNRAIVSCDAVGSEIEAMYDKWYPVDSSTENLSRIQLTSIKLSKSATVDTAYKRLLNKLITRDIKARHLKLVLQNCQKMKRLFPTEGGTYFASAFIYNLQHKYPLATTEIKQEIALENNNDLGLILAIIERKANHAEVSRR